MFDPQNVTAEEFISYAGNAGYSEMDSNEFGPLNFANYKDGTFLYICAMYDNNEGDWLVGELFISLGQDGKLHGDFAGTCVASGLDYQTALDQAKQYIQFLNAKKVA